eukprot:g8900.t1
MAIREGPWQSKNDHEFTLRALRSGRRADGRRLGDMRLLRMVFARAEGQASAEIQLGRTRVLGVVTGEVVPPFPDRPTEGFLLFNVDLGPMAAASVGDQRNSPLSVEIARIIETGVRDSQALDTEALCIIGGEKVWSLRCDVHILDHGGNLIDASALATMAALRHFRRPDVTIDGSKVEVHHTDDKEPHPLALHHVPMCVTFAIFEDAGDISMSRSTGGGGRSTSKAGGAGKSASVSQHTVVDPTEAEEEVMKGRISFALTAHQEICALHKNGGVAMSRETVLGCARLAASKVKEMHAVLDKALAAADAKAALERQSRLRGTNPSAAGAGAGPGPVPGMVQGKIPGTLPGTGSTPFVVGQAPMPVAPESLKVKHLDYDDLHVTQSIREEGLRGGGNRGGRGLDMDDARNTDLFAKMAAAARMTEARIAEEDGHQRNYLEAGNAASTTTRNRSRQNSGGAGSSAMAGKGKNGERCPGSPALGGGSGGREPAGEETSEFARMAQTLREQAEKSGAVSGGGAQPPVAAAAAATAAATAAMDVDSDEEETVTLEGEFKAARGGAAEGVRAVAAEEVVVKVVKGGQTAEPGKDDDDGEDDDLLSAVKKGKVHPGHMFSSGSDVGSPRTREYQRGASVLTSTIGDVFESSGGVTGPVMSPVHGRSTSSSSGLGEATTMMLIDGEIESVSPSHGGGELATKPFTESEPRRSRTRVANGGGVGSGFGSGSGLGSGAGGGASGPTARGLENAEGGAHTSASPRDGHHQQQRQAGSGLLLPPADIEIPNGASEEPLQGVSSSSSSGGGNGSSGNGSISPSARRRGSRPLPPAAEPNPEFSKGVKSNKRRHVPTPKHRLPNAWGALPAGGEAAANGEGEGQGSEEEQQDAAAGDLGDSPSSSDFNSNSGNSNKASDSGVTASASTTAATAAATNINAKKVSASAPADALLAAPPAPAPPAPQAPIDFSNNDLPASDLLSEFDSNTTWAGASAISVATTRTGTGWGSVLETSSALSQYPSSHLSTTAAKLDAAAVWTQQPLGKSGDLNGVSVTTANRRSRGRASPPHNLRVPGGTPARRGLRKPKQDSSSKMSSSGGDDSSKPRSLAKPVTTSRRAAMSPHGVAMDAAIRIVEERGARLGIVREEKEDAAAAAAAAAANSSSDQAKDAAYANQIAAPAMTSLEQRRQRAKAWAKSRAIGTSHQIRTGAMPDLAKKIPRPRHKRRSSDNRRSGDSNSSSSRRPPPQEPSQDRGRTSHQIRTGAMPDLAKKIPRPRHKRRSSDNRRSGDSNSSSSRRPPPQEPSQDRGRTEHPGHRRSATAGSSVANGSSAKGGGMSSSGSEADIGNPRYEGVTPARSRRSTRSATGVTPARSRSSRSGGGSGGTAGKAPPLPRGTARDRHATPARDRHCSRNGGGGGSAGSRSSATAASGNGSSDSRTPVAAGGGGSGHHRAGSSSAASATSSRGTSGSGRSRVAEADAAAAARERSRAEAAEKEAAATAAAARAEEEQKKRKQQQQQQQQQQQEREAEARVRREEEEARAAVANARVLEETKAVAAAAVDKFRRQEEARKAAEWADDDDDVDAASSSRSRSSDGEESEMTDDGEDEDYLEDDDDDVEQEEEEEEEEEEGESRVLHRRERGDSSESAEMLSEEVEEEEEEEEEEEDDDMSAIRQSSDDYNAETLLAEHAAAVLREKEGQQQSFAMHRAVFDNDVDYLEILLDQAVAAQEEEHEARAGTALEGVGAVPPAAFSSVGGAEELPEDAPPSVATGPGGMDEVDHHGNTPLLLALQLGRLECANALLEAGANVDIKSGRRYHLMDEAVLTGDQAIVRQVYMRAQQLTWLRWKGRLPHLLDILEEIPDFYVEMKWSFSAAFLMAPLMQAVAPSDTYRIWKRGSWLRIDSTIVGVGARFKLKRGRLSLVFMGKDSATPGVLLRVDHTKSKVYNALRRLEWQTNREVDKAVHNLMASSNKGGVDSTQFKAKKTVFRESHKSDGGQQVQAVMAGWNCSTYQYLGSMQMKTTRKGGNVVQYVPKHRYFDTRGDKPLLTKAKEAIAREEAATAAGAGGGGGGGLKKGVGASMFQKPFWKNNPDLNEDKVHRQINKQVKATVWMAHDYPLKLKHIMPALEILSVRDDMAARLRSVLSLAGIPQEGFPVKVSVPLMMTVKAVVTFENFRSDGIDPSNFVVPAEYQRSRRMSKEKYIAGVVSAGGGGGGGGESGERGNSGAMDSDDDDEEADFVDVDEAELSDGEILRRRAAQKNAFDDDEDDSDFDDDEITDDGTPCASPQPSNAQLLSPPQSPSQASPPEATAPRLATSAVAAAAAAAAPSSDSRGQDEDPLSSRKGHSRPQSRGRSLGATTVGGAPTGAAGAPIPAPHKRQRSKSRSRRLVSQLKGIVGAGKGKSSSRRGSATSMGNGRMGGGQYSLSEDDEEDSYEDDEGDFGRRGSGEHANGGGNGNGGGGGGGILTTASQAAQLPRTHRRSSSASGSNGTASSLSGLLGAPAAGGSNLQRPSPGSMSNLRAAADVQTTVVAGPRLPRARTALSLSGGGGGGGGGAGSRSRGGAAGGVASGRGSALSAPKPAPRNSE